MGVKQHHLRIGFLIIAISLLGLFVGVALQHWLSTERSVVLEPRKVVLTQDPLEGEVVKVPLVLRNDTNRPVSVVRSAGSCGCMDATVRAGHPLLKGTTLATGGTMPWLLEINTTGYVGKRHFTFGVDCLSDGKHVVVASEIEMNVRPGMRIEPSTLIFSDAAAGHPVKSEFMVLDALPDPGTKISKCVSSAPNRLKVSLEHVAASEMKYGNEVRLKARYRGIVSYTPPQGRRLSHDWITLVPKGGRGAGRTAIAVVCSTRQPLYSMVPQSLVLVSSVSARKYRREFRCIVRDDAKRPLRVQSKPEWLEVTIRELDSTTVAIDILAFIGAGQEQPSGTKVVFSAGMENEPVLTLPVRLVSLVNIDKR